MIVKFGLYKINLTELTDKVTENFTGKELDDETELGYWGARYLDLMLGLWTSVDGHKEFYNSYSYGPINPINGYDEEGNIWRYVKTEYFNTFNFFNAFSRIVGEITRIGRITVVAAGINEESLLYRSVIFIINGNHCPMKTICIRTGLFEKFCKPI